MAKLIAKIESIENLPNFRTVAIPRTTAIGCLRQNSWSCGEKACFLLSKCTDGVGGNNCSRVNSCVGQSGGDGGGASQDSIEHGAGGSLLSIDLQSNEEFNLDFFEYTDEISNFYNNNGISGPNKSTFIIQENESLLFII